MTFFRRVADRARERGDPGEPRSDRPHERRYLFVARFSATDAMLLRELVSQIAELVGGPSLAGQGTPADEDAAAPPGDEPQAGGAAARDMARGETFSGEMQSGEMQSGEMQSGEMQSGEMQSGEMAGDLADALGLTEDADLPDDPALARLLPDAYPDDCEASSEFRRYTEKDLRAAKLAAAKTVLATLPEGGGRISLSESEAQVWLRALNDIRLALGVRLGIAEDVNEEMDQIRPDDPRYGALAVYDWLSGTQESLVHALS